MASRLSTCIATVTTVSWTVPVRIDRLVERARDHGMTALALTDHGNLHGALEFYQTALKAGVKPIVGYEAYIAPGSRFDKTSGNMREASYHLTLLAQNRVGFQNLMKLASAAYLEGFYFKPRIDKELLAAHQRGAHLPERLCVERIQSGLVARAWGGRGAARGDRGGPVVPRRVWRPLLHRDHEQRCGDPASVAARERWRSPTRSGCRWWPPATRTTWIGRIPKCRTCCSASTPGSTGPTRAACGWTATSTICAARRRCTRRFRTIRMPWRAARRSPIGSTCSWSWANATFRCLTCRRGRRRNRTCGSCANRGCASDTRTTRKCAATVN